MLHLAVGREREIWKTVKQHRQRDFRLHLAKPCTKAIMRSTAKGEMLDIFALDIELARIGV